MVRLSGYNTMHGQQNIEFEKFSGFRAKRSYISCPVATHVNEIHSLPSSPFNTHFNIIPLRHKRWLFFRAPDWNSARIMSSNLYVLQAPPISRPLDLITRTITRGVQIFEVTYCVLIINPTRCTNFSNLFLEQNSTCFGQFVCPTSGVSHCTHSNGICHTGLLTACEQDRDGVLSGLCDIYHCCVYSENSWWWTQELSETCRVLFQK